MSSKKDVPEKDPFEVLGLPFGATDAEVAKAYRKLARTLHPDKLADVSDAEREHAATRFQELQNARSFLLNHEFADAKEKYLAKRASEQLRREADRARETAMSQRRKRMRDELRQQETQAKQRPNTSKSALAEEGRKMRQEYASRAAEEQENDRNKARKQLDNRQIRLKWSRKKLKAAGVESPSEDSIAKMLTEFGIVRDVQMIGNKGNVALVTFEDEQACDKVVDAYSTSELWRAAYVNKSKQAEAATAAVDSFEEPISQPHRRDHETVDDWKLRRDSAREELLRQMEREENGDDSGPDSKAVPFPPPFPDSEEYSALESPLAKLEMAEELILKGILPSETVLQMKILS